MFLAFLLASCADKPESVAEAIKIKSEYKAKVNSTAGDFFEDDAFKPMPIFFNIGSMKINEETNAETIILSDKLTKGKTIDIKPISLLRFIHDYHDFSQKQYQIKFLLEDWFRGNCKLGRCSKFEWQSEVQALKLIE